jgi:AcrR family transcriptional regulator
MEEVATRAGVSKALIYRQFPSKDSLVQAMFDQVIDALSSVKAQPWGGYAAGTISTIRAARLRPAAFLLLYRDCRGDPTYSVHFERLQELYIDWLMLFFPSQQGQTTVRAVRTVMAVRNMIGFLLEALSNWLTIGPPEEDKAWAAWIGDMLRSWKRNTEYFLQIPPLQRLAR